MQYAFLGKSGLKVSRIALGCMSFGDTSKGFNEWALNDEQAEPIFRQALDLGITFWDTANIYGIGTSEEIVGRAIKKYSKREDIVLATKVNFKMHDGPGGEGLSRKAIMEQIDASLRRLGTDYVDLYQIHRFDPNTPVEETMEALHDVIKAGKVRYIGASSMWAWQFSKMQYSADLHGWTRFISMQNQYSLIQREEEREMFPLLKEQGVASIPWAPLGKGRLARPYGTHTHRFDHDRRSRRDRHEARSPDGANFDCVGFKESEGHSSDCWANEGTSPCRSGGGLRYFAYVRGDRKVRGKLHASHAIWVCVTKSSSFRHRRYLKCQLFRCLISQHTSAFR
jgi:aryl-alcohol dehydrogenase-like predicted oxidoreductase